VFEFPWIHDDDRSLEQCGLWIAFCPRIILLTTSRVFGSVVVVAFQIAFRAEIHANDVFLFFKNHF
jgi:hypothetical protein